MYNTNYQPTYAPPQPDPSQWFAQALIGEITRDANKDLLHNVLWQRFNPNNFQNSEFARLVDNAVEMGAYLVACNGGNPNQMIMDDAVAKTITLTGILMLEQNPQWERELPPHVIQSLRGQAGNLKNLLNQVINFTNQPPMGNQYQSPQPQWQDPRNLRNQPQPPVYGSVGGGVRLGAGSTPSNYHSPQPAPQMYQNAGPRGVQTSYPNATPQNTGPRRTVAAGRPHNEPRSGGIIENVSSPGVAQARYQAAEERTNRRYGSLYRPDDHVAVNTPPQQNYSEPQIPDDDDRHFFQEVFGQPEAQPVAEDEFRIAHPAEWPLIWKKAKRNPDQPYSITYNPRTQVKYYRFKDDGSIEQKIEPIMNYTDHEPNPVLRREAENNQHSDEITVPVAALLSGDSIDISAVKVDDSAEKPTPVAETPKVITNKTVIVATSETEARVFANAELRARNIHSLPNDAAVEFYYQQNNLLGVYDEPLYEEVVGMVKEFSLLNTETQLSDMAELLKKQAGCMPIQLWHRINDHATEVINSLVSNELGYGGDLTIDSFSDDFDLIMDRLHEELGDAVIARIGKIIPAIRRDIANILTGEALETARKFQKAQYRANNRQKELEWVIDHSIISAELISITRVPQTAKRLDLVLDTPVVVIKESTTPTLYLAIAGIFDRADRLDRTFTHHYLDTSDGVRIELHRALLGNGTCFVASKV